MSVSANSVLPACSTWDALLPGGTLVIEPHTYEAVQSIGRAPNTWYRSESGLFADIRIREDWPTHSDALMLWTAQKG